MKVTQENQKTLEGVAKMAESLQLIARAVEAPMSGMGKLIGVVVALSEGRADMSEVMHLSGLEAGQVRAIVSTHTQLELDDTGLIVMFSGAFMYEAVL